MSEHHTSPTPNDFTLPCAPARPIGIETEYHLQGIELSALFIQNAMAQQNLAQMNSYLSNGARLYPYQGVEYATPESLGPRQAAVADFAGKIIVAKLEAYRNSRDGAISHFPALRNAGSYSVDKNACESRGHHRNYQTITPETTEQTILLKNVMGSFLATTPIWDGVGFITDQYLLAQKAPGIGNPITNGGDNQTKHGSKPIGNFYTQVVSGGAEDKIHTGWSLLEVRKDDAHMLLTNAYMGYAATSIALRLVEQGYINQDNAADFTLAETANSLKIVNTTFGKDKLRLASGKHTDALSLQKRYTDMMYKMLSEQEQPQEDEVDALERLTIILDKLDILAHGDIHDTDVKPLVPYVEWAAKLHYLRQKVSPNYTAHPDKLEAAVAFDLQWHRIDEKSVSQIVGNRIDTFGNSLANEIETAIEMPPLSRAFARGAAVEANICDSLKWNQLSLKSGRVVELVDVWCPDLAVDDASDQEKLTA